METYEFTCPACARCYPVDESARQATVENGCPVCGHAVTRDHFASC